jgi:hypothetical protein
VTSDKKNPALIITHHASRITGCLCAAIGLALFSFQAIAQSVSNNLWQAQSIYQIITDRFFDGDPSNNNADDR